MSVRSSMTMRAFTKRRIQTGTDTYGQPIYSNQSYLSDLPCKFWYPKGGGEHRKIEDKDTLILKSPRMICPFYMISNGVRIAVDIDEKDTIEKIEDRRTDSLFGAFTIDSIQRRKDHYDIVLSEVG
jgi:hypothetical protein